MQRKRRGFQKGGLGLSPANCARRTAERSACPCRRRENFATPIATPWGMALHWGNRASMTHSLTPSPSNRPLFFEILTPCEKPVAAGSAGRCESAVGRFTDPQPFTCSFFTPPFCSVMFGQYALPTALSKPVRQVEENFLFQRGQSHASMCCLYRPGRACFFLFLPIPSFSQPLLSEWRRNQLSLTWGWPLPPDSLTTGSHGSNRAGLGLCWCRFSTPPSDRPKTATQGRVWFFSPKRDYPSS